MSEPKPILCEKGHPCTFCDDIRDKNYKIYFCKTCVKTVYVYPPAPKIFPNA